MAAARSHVPCVSSPLNPYRQKRACNVARGASSRTCHRNVSISPSEALSRHKASEAWRRCTLSEVREYEGVLDKALMAREGDKAGLKRSSSHRNLSDVAGLAGTLGEVTLGSDEKQHGLQGRYRDSMPGLGFLSPRRVALAVGLRRRLPSLGLVEWLRCEPPSLPQQ
ncbi:uncharacterized protein UV8b_04500 [Ustilaginoidea virens]|uniref:Uncharacterized protein n=1 Tax=Ustilaginoidea virens TaxID=1159556 RepID=A0A8E5HRK8_USTVR|nr:uncharacterized protein UV8b_04500 [Ustilaginoidea virens]QUC20259.1 hypothetical protein UV8b_04500 [Ustilaginoidea virens]